MNEHVEYFKRWSECYLMWSHSNMDRIVRETVKRHKDAIKQEKVDNSDFAKVRILQRSFKI